MNTGIYYFAAHKNSPLPFHATLRVIELTRSEWTWARVLVGQIWYRLETESLEDQSEIEGALKASKSILVILSLQSYASEGEEPKRIAVARLYKSKRREKK